MSIKFGSVIISGLTLSSIIIYCFNRYSNKKEENIIENNIERIL